MQVFTVPIFHYILNIKVTPQSLSNITKLQGAVIKFENDCDVIFTFKI